MSETSTGEGQSHASTRSRLYAANLDGYRATPLLDPDDEEYDRLVARQESLKAAFSQAADELLSQRVSPTAVKFIQDAITTRMDQRAGYNSQAYRWRLYKEPNHDIVPEIKDYYDLVRICKKAVHSEGTPYENHIAGRAHGEESSELTNITTIDGYRRIARPAMWEELSDLTGSNAAPVVGQPSDLRIIGMDPDTQVMRVSEKRLLSSIHPESIVKVKTHLIVDITKNSGFDKRVLRELSEVRTKRRGQSYQLQDLPLFEAAVRHLLASEAYSLSGPELARNDTVYEYHPLVAAVIKENRRYSDVSFADW